MIESSIMKKKRIEMIEAFSRLSPGERSAEAETRLDESLERMANIHHITTGEAYEKLVENRNRLR